MQTVLPRVEANSEVCATPARNHAAVACMAYFAYLAILGAVRSAPPGRIFVLVLLPVIIWCLCRTRMPARALRAQAVHGWCLLALILPGYWMLDWFATPPLAALQAGWLEFDRTLLETAGLRHVIESTGSLLPCILEFVYLLLYAIPAAALVSIYATGNRNRGDRFLRVLLPGTFAAYSLLPHVPVQSPRYAFPDGNLPRYDGVARRVNTWLLDRLDITTGVFPSGHVAVAFSSAFGLLSAVPERGRTIGAAFALAVVVYIATVYGRYHYAVDGLASFLIVSTVWTAGRAFRWV